MSKLHPPYIVERTNHIFTEKISPVLKIQVKSFEICFIIQSCMTQCVFFQPFQLWPIFCFQIKQKVYFVFPLILIYEMPYTDEWNVRHLVLFPPPRFPETAELPPNVIRWPHLPQRNSLPHLTSWLLDLGNGYQSLQPVHTILQTREVVHFGKTDGQVNEAFLGDVFNQ